MRAGWLALAVAVLLSGCHTRAGVASIGSQDRPSPVSYRVTGTVTVGKGPAGVAVDPGTHTVYVANTADDTVSVIDAATRTVVGTIPVSDKPSAIAVDPGTHTVFVRHSGYQSSGNGPYRSEAANVSVIDGATRTVIATVPVGKGCCSGLTVDPAAHLVYVTNDEDDTLSVIDGKGPRPTYAVIDTVPVGAELTGVAVDPGKNSIYAVTERGGTGGNSPPVGKNLVRVIDGVSRTVTATIPGGPGPRAVTVDHSTHDVYVANFWGRDVSVIDGSTQSLTATVPVAAGVAGVPGFEVDPSTHTVYVTSYDTNADSGTLSVIDGSTRVVTSTVAVGKNLRGLAVDPVTHVVYVANDPESSSKSTIDGTVSIIESVIG
ncbi:MAG: hypothetical protein ACOYO2_13040 [Mycobacterium sp.]